MFSFSVHKYRYCKRWNYKKPFCSSLIGMGFRLFTFNWKVRVSSLMSPILYIEGSQLEWCISSTLYYSILVRNPWYRALWLLQIISSCNRFVQNIVNVWMFDTCMVLFISLLLYVLVMFEFVLNSMLCRVCCWFRAILCLSFLAVGNIGCLTPFRCWNLSCFFFFFFYLL